MTRINTSTMTSWTYFLKAITETVLARLKAKRKKRREGEALLLWRERGVWSVSGQALGDEVCRVRAWLSWCRVYVGLAREMFVGLMKWLWSERRVSLRFKPQKNVVTNLYLFEI